MLTLGITLGLIAIGYLTLVTIEYALNRHERRAARGWANYGH